MTHRRVSAISRARTADDTSLRTRRNAFASATYQTSSSVGPDRNGYWSIASHRPSRLPNTRNLVAGRFPRSSSSTSCRSENRIRPRASASRYWSSDRYG